MPVDIATGAVRLEFDDVVIPGKVNLVWNRLYSTPLLDGPATPMGRGWTSRYFATLTRTQEGYQFLTPEGDIEVFSDLAGSVELGGIVRRLGTFEEIFRLDRRYVVQRWDVETGEIQRYCFSIDQHDQPLRLTSIEDVTGQAVDLVWDAQGRLAEVRQRLEKRALVLGYTPSGLIKSIMLQAPDGERHPLARYEYDAQGRQIAAYDAANYADRYEYDPHGRVQREIVKDGGIFNYRYDEKNRCIKTSGLDHYAERRLRFFDAINITEVTNSYNKTSRYQYLPSGQIIREIDPLGNEKSTEYDEHGRIVAKTDATNATTRYTYDEAGNRNSVTDALGNTYRFTYNGQHLPRSMTDPLDRVWWRGYDESNRLIGIQDPLGHRWLIHYDAEGNATKVQNPLGACKYQKFTDGVLQAVTDWMGNVTRFQLDNFGRVTQRTGTLGEVTCFRYDSHGNPVEVILPDQSVLKITYDSVGNLTNFIDGNGYSTRFRYGPCQRLLERVNPVGGVVRYIWGTEPGWLEQVVNEKGETYTFFRDEIGHIAREISFDAAERHFQYDAEGYAIAYTNANGEKIVIQRDALHRAIGQTLPDGEQVNYTFDPIGHLIGTVNADIAVAFERDPLGRIVKEIQGEQWVESRYDAVGNLIHTATSLGYTVDYEVDANSFISKLTTLGNQSLEFKHNAYGQETHRQMTGGMVMEQRYDNFSRLVEQRIGPGRLESGDASVIPAEHEIIRRNYTYDRNGSLTSIVDGRWGRVDYVYDPAERLLQAIRERGSSEAFVYDATGNITCLRSKGKNFSNNEVLSYGPGNRLLQKGNTYYEYDAEGRLIKKIELRAGDNVNTWTYKWSVLNRLKEVVRPDGEVVRYRYDTFARRVEKTIAGKTQKILWDKDVIIHEFDSAGLLSSWIFDPHSFAPLATVQSSQLFSIINDHLGTPNELIDNFGRIAWSSKLMSWGDSCKELATDSSSVYCNIRFQGQWSDDETLLVYNYNRYYDPQSGRYISHDPIGLSGGFNLYCYAPNPVGWFDPLGCYEISMNTAGTDTLARGAHVNARGPGLPPKGGHVGLVPNAAGTGLTPVPVDKATRDLNSKQWNRLSNDVVAFFDSPGNVRRLRAQAQAGIDAFPNSARARELEKVRDICDEHLKEGTNPCR
jgi:RHS repeat-associated protein